MIKGLLILSGFIFGPYLLILLYEKIKGFIEYMEYSKKLLKIKPQLEKIHLAVESNKLNWLKNEFNTLSNNLENEFKINKFYTDISVEEYINKDNEIRAATVKTRNTVTKKRFRKIKHWK